MAFDQLAREMYCPKCKDTFEDGSRRFCPTDGTRLILEDVDAPGRAGGIFSNLLPNINHDTARDEIPAKAKMTVTAPASEDDLDLFGDTIPQFHPSEPFFEIRDIQPESEPVANFSVPETPAIFAQTDVRNYGRKVNPYDIPAGHVELGDSDPTMPIFNEYDAENPESFVGRTVKGRYRVNDFLGGDGSGLAYLADDKIVADRMVLVRILLEDSSDEIINSILAEERVSLSHLTHPNIARLIDSGEFTDGTKFLVTEYTDALSVRDVLGIHGHFDGLRAARVVRQASYALNEAHQEGIIHRDIRPENLILSSENDAEQTMVVNFGASNGEPNAYNAAYKAPEVLDGRLPTVSSDIFSLAVVAYEMLTGNLPFDGETGKEIVKKQYGGLAEPPSTLRTELPHAVDEILARALSFNASDRFVKARDFGDAFSNSLTEPAMPVAVAEPPDAVAAEPASQLAPVPLVAEAAVPPMEHKVEILRPIVSNQSNPVVPSWKARSPEPLKVESSRSKLVVIAGILALVTLLAVGWFYFASRPPESGPPVAADENTGQANTDPNSAKTSADTEPPPPPRSIAQPPNTEFFQTSKSVLKGDLLRNFVGFSLYYPKDWKITGPQESTTANSRGKFVDISRSTPDGQLKEQMLISYYPSKGTFKDDKDKFAAMVKETNDTLKKLIPDYQMVAEGETVINGGWRAYEVKFQGGGTSAKGAKLVVWGRRLFVPAARPGTRDGFEITMLATSLADDVRSVDDVGVHGELATILQTFEPGQNF